ncbi:carboxypeptidase-like regulatory domain-containing protein [Pedobacter cryophilus]|uniref:Carboxypeptidase-like regulatory domain-containing protein n=1 Tax=Pedobacter cryophilus TaxID=2571271 RepID=A0A4U1BSX4_9SPHI|nr:carboxypeptidase-like regulatory domain-containing protein [Pedobacter cryophilus]TKB95164.1 carboxypeptidase-like regulatory domain-containing protein [Pedobacter cryophilus]
MFKYLFILLFSVYVNETYAQENFTISGIVKDKQGESLPGAGIFVSGYKNATISNNNGEFSLKLNPGNYELLVKMVGFKSGIFQVIVSDKNIGLNITLVENTIQLNEVVVKPDLNREYNLKTFTEFFIGKTPNAAQCKIINPDVLYLNFDQQSRTLTASCDEFLLIENKALGYKIKYLIKEFEYDMVNRIIFYQGSPYYEDLPASDSKKKQWAKKRLEAYNGSPQHFFRSLYEENSIKEGFVIHKLIKHINTQRPPDSLIKANIRRFRAKTGDTFFLNGKTNDSLEYWLSKNNMPKTISTLNKAEVLPDTLVKTFDSNIKKIDFNDILYVVYKNEKEHPIYANLFNQSISRPLDMPNYQISLINLSIRPIYFYQSGAIYNTKSMIYEGYWSWEKVADSVPMDYLPVRLQAH